MAGRLTRAALPALGLASLYGLSVVLGRATRLVGSEVSLMWPAAAIAVLWALHAHTLTPRAAAVHWGLLAAVTFGVNLTTGASVGLSLWFVLVNLALAWITTTVLTYDGRAVRLRDPHDLGRLIAAVGVGTAAAGVLATGWFALAGEDRLLEILAVFTVRNGVTALAGVAIVLRLREPRPRIPLTNRHVLEGGYFLLVTAIVLALLWGLPGVPLAFLVTIPALWVALRFSALSGALFIVGSAASMAASTLSGNGPFRTMPPMEQALLAQSLLGTITVTVLALALYRDSRNDLITQLRHLALHDPLTGLANRALLIERLEQGLERPRSLRGRLGVLYIDLDGFKQVNDAWGHREGDLLLGEMARRIEAMAEPGDLVARLGGDEFVVACFGIADQADLHRRAERIRACVAVPYGDPSDAPYDRITASIGTALSDRSSTARSLLVAADRAMYDAKRSGRNRTLPTSYVLRGA